VVSDSVCIVCVRVVMLLLLVARTKLTLQLYRTLRKLCGVVRTVVTIVYAKQCAERLSQRQQGSNALAISYVTTATTNNQLIYIYITISTLII
jgi:hypothetical protein